jgi:hypothetical protein
MTQEPPLALFAREASPDYGSTSSNNAKGGTLLAEARQTKKKEAE